MRRPDSVWVRNNGPDTFRDKFDGEDIVIEPGHTVELDAAAAKLIFGFGEKDKSRALRRLGWLDQTKELQNVLARLGKFAFFTSDPQKSSLSAPGSARDASDSSKDGSGAIPHKPVNVLEKLAHATPAAG